MSFVAFCALDLLIQTGLRDGKYQTYIPESTIFSVCDTKMEGKVGLCCVHCVKLNFMFPEDSVIQAENHVQHSSGNGLYLGKPTKVLRSKWRPMSRVV